MDFKLFFSSARCMLRCWNDLPRLCKYLPLSSVLPISPQVFSALRAMNGADYIPNSVVEDNAPALNAHYDAIMSHPKVSFLLTQSGLRIICIFKFGSSEGEFHVLVVHGLWLPTLARALSSYEVSAILATVWVLHT